MQGQQFLAKFLVFCENFYLLVYTRKVARILYDKCIWCHKKTGAPIFMWQGKNVVCESLIVCRTRDRKFGNFFGGSKSSSEPVVVPLLPTVEPTKFFQFAFVFPFPSYIIKKWFYSTYNSCLFSRKRYHLSERGRQDFTSWPCNVMRVTAVQSRYLWS